jgi:endonuclease I
MHKIILLSLLCFTTLLNAQYHTDVLSGESGSTLLTNLKNNYKPLFLPDYSTAKTNMFNYIYKENDTVACVYTGLKRYLPATSDPSTIMFDNGSSVSINTEHTYPQSKTTSNAGKADLHHIYPTRAETNNDRGSLPLGEISGNNIDKWYFEENTLTSAPASNVLHLHSKLDNNTLFEPRDEHKGNAARAMFYYYTMYKLNADAADPNFFNNQKAKLCQWHLDDPVDSLEWLRTTRISIYQSLKKNPFVMDCTLPQRCGYCSQTCTPPNALSNIESMGLQLFDAFPNPSSDKTTISFEVSRTQKIRLTIYNNLGQEIEILCNREFEKGLYEFNFNTVNHPAGLYYLQLSTEKNGKSASRAKNLIISK